MNRLWTRRSFVRRGSAAAAATSAITFPHILPSKAKGSTEKLHIASIGTMGQGRSDRRAVSRSEDIVALCDVDSGRLAEAGRDSPKARRFTDFREMFDRMGDTIDAVIVSTPDHAHFPIAIAAIELGMHVCVQTPLSNRISEVRELQRAAHEKKIVTQMGNQGRTKEGQRLVNEWIAQGVIGKLSEIKIWTDRPLWPQGSDVKGRDTGIPKELDWKLWQAQIPDKPFSENIHPRNWRAWWDYGSGALGDMGCHLMDPAFGALGEIFPESIEAQSGKCTSEVAPDWSSLIYRFEDDRTLSWDDGRRDGKMNRPEKPEALHSLGDEAWEKASNGMVFIGEEGAIFSSDIYCSSATIFPSERREEVREMTRSGKILRTERRSTHPGEPQKEWVYAIKNGRETSSQFVYSAPLSEFVLLGNIAIRAGKPITWESEKTSTGDDEVDRFVKRESYRDGWTPDEDDATP